LYLYLFCFIGYIDKIKVGRKFPHKNKKKKHTHTHRTKTPKKQQQQPTTTTTYERST